MRSNCLWFIVLLWWRRRGGWPGTQKRKEALKRLRARREYLDIRISDWGPFPHFLYVGLSGRPAKWRCISYVPLDPKHKTCPPPLFSGRVRWGDPKKETSS